MERIITSLLLLGAALYLTEARTMTFGSLSAPKSGFLPILAGVTAILLAVFLLLQGQKKEVKQGQQEIANWVKFTFVMIGLVFYVTMISTAGYLLATWILLIYLFKVADTEGWLVPVAIGAGASVSFYFIFAKYLLVPLP